MRDCWVSLYSAPAISYRARLGDAATMPAMGVTVQLMVDAAVSGVMFTCNPVSGDPSMVAINASWGLGLAVVGGEVTPDDFLVSKVTREVVREHVARQGRRVRARPGGPRRRAASTCPPSGATRAASTTTTLAALVDVGARDRAPLRLATRTSSGRSRAATATLFIVQSRPVTALPRARRGAGRVGACRS